MNRPSRATLLRYGAAALAIALATGLRLLLDPLLGSAFPFATLFLAILVTAWYGGFGPAFAATLLGAAASIWLLLPPQPRPPAHGYGQPAGVVLYLVVGLGIAALGGAMRAARRRAEDDAAALRQTEALLDAVINHAPACIFAKDRRGRYLLANRALASLVGREQSEFKGRTDFDFFPPEVAEQFGKDDAAILASGQPHTYEESFPQDGVTRTYLTVKFPLRDEMGTAYAACAVATEVTELKRAQDALRSTAERLNLALAAARLGDWSWDAATDVVTFSDRAADIFGIPPGPHLTWTEMQGLLHDEDRGRARGRVEEAVANRTQYEIEYRVNRPGGGQVWVAALGRAHYSPSGQPLGMFGVVQDITARKEAEESLRESEERLRLALEAGRMGVWDWDLRTNQIKWSDNLEPVYGLSPGTFGGTFEAFQRLIHPEDRESVSRAIARSLEERASYDIEFRNVWPDNTVHWMSGKGKVFTGDDGRPARMVGVGMDVTERKRAEQDARFLADASATLAGLVDYESTLQKVARLAVPHFADWCAVDMLDEGGGLRRLAVAHVDPAKVELAHELHRRFPPDPASGQGVWKVVRTGGPEVVPEITDGMLAASVRDPELLRIMRELGLRSYMGVPLRSRGRVLGAVTFLAAESGRRYDADDLAVAEDLAHRAAVAIENARLYQEVREADRKKDEFLSLLAHELRNPLAPISNALQILKLAGPNVELVGQAREMAERQVHALTRMVDDLLDVSRIMRGKVELRRERVELAAVVARAVETARPAVDAGRHRLEVSPPAQPVWIDADVVRGAQVVSNLLNNAAKYTESGGRIWLVAGREGGRAVVRVRDTGIGITPDKLRSVFDLFVQVDASGTRAQGGLGIGLTVVRNLVEMHGGTVEARSDGLGHGSEFVVRLPLAEGDTGPSSSPRAASEQGGASPRRILVVDDNADAADSLAMLLRLQGHAVSVAHDGPSGLRLAEADPPEVAFLDIGMPVMSGHELAMRFRSHPALRTVTLVAMTGWGQEQDRRRTREAGFDHHLVKPVELDAVNRVLSTPTPPRD